MLFTFCPDSNVLVEPERANFPDTTRLMEDVRRVCAMPPAANLEKTQFLLGDASVQTTERYVEWKQNLRRAVDHRLAFALRT